MTEKLKILFFSSSSIFLQKKLIYGYLLIEKIIKFITEAKIFNKQTKIIKIFTGMHFSQAVAIIQSQIGTIRGVQVLYSENVSFYLYHPCEE